VSVTAGEAAGKTNDSSVSLAVKTVATESGSFQQLPAYVNVDNVLAATAAVFVPASVHSEAGRSRRILDVQQKLRNQI